MPVTINSEGAGRSVAVASGNCSGCSTANKLGSAPGTTFGGGGASAAGSAWREHPAITSQPGEERKPEESEHVTFSTCAHLVSICACSPMCFALNRLELHHDGVPHAWFILP